MVWNFDEKRTSCQPNTHEPNDCRVSRCCKSKDTFTPGRLRKINMHDPRPEIQAYSENIQDQPQLLVWFSN
jgi:hypothetical protein